MPTSREELHRKIWAIADDLRNGVDGHDFKAYVLSTMFYRFISEDLIDYINEGEIAAGNIGFNYPDLDDETAEMARKGLIESKGFFILPSELFCNLHKVASNDENLNETLSRVFKNIENSAIGTPAESRFKGLFDDFDVNSRKLGATVDERNKTLLCLINGIAAMELGKFSHATNDLFGDAYEFIIGMYASNAGKSGGEFYTPQEVSKLLTLLALDGKTKVESVYDPTCGSGSLLMQSAKIIGKDNITKGFFGQEKNITTHNLCRMNMFLHGINYNKFNIACGDTLMNPQHLSDIPFEVIVSNPPYSIHWEGDDNPILINDERFAPAGVLAPKKNADFAFILHSLYSLATNGVASIVCFPGIMYRGKAEQKIRQYLIDNNYVDSIVQLPENIFYGTSIATCIMTLKKSKKDTNVLFIDASKEFIKVASKNKLTDENIKKIVNKAKSRENVEYFSRLVSYDEIKGNDYNLSVSTYVKAEDTREVIDIVKLNSEIDEIVAREKVLRDEIAKIIAEIEVQ